MINRMKRIPAMAMPVKGRFGATVLLIQLIFVLLFVFFVEYGEEANAINEMNYYWNTTEKTATATYGFVTFFPVFQNVNALIFVGVGFLYTFLKRCGYSGIGMNMMVAGIAIQWSLLTDHWWILIKDMRRRLRLDVKCLLTAEIAAASAVIALGGVFGKINPLQMVIFTLIEVFFYTMNEHFCEDILQVTDIGYSVKLHMFCGIFGCVVAYVLDRMAKTDGIQSNKSITTSYRSNILAMLGTALLWVYWPSFNAALSTGDAQERCALNTFLALLGSCLTAFAASSLMNEHNKFYMGHIQSATLAGGVAIGTTADLMIQPFGALLIGAMGGCISVFNFQYITPLLARCKIYDPCGIGSLHLMPGLFSGITGIIAALFATRTFYGYTLYKLYPAMAPRNNTAEYKSIHRISPNVQPGLGRSPGIQAAYQLLYIVVNILIPIVSGIVTGLLLRLKFFGHLDNTQMYTDEPFWVVPEKKKKRKKQKKEQRKEDRHLSDSEV